MTRQFGAALLAVLLWTAFPLGAQAQPVTGQVDGEVAGFSVALHDATLAVGVVGASTPVEYAGAVNVYGWNGSDWVFDTRLVPPASDVDRHFGYSVVAGEDVIAVGASEDREAAYEAGAVFVYRRGAAGWAFEAKLTAEDAMPGDEFGQSMAIDGNRLLIGAPGHPASTLGGAAYIFEFDGQTWAQTAKLLPADQPNGEAFGWSVALRDSRALIGAPFSSGTGAAYLFENDGAAWSESATYRAPSPSLSDQFGYAVALWDTSAFVSAPRFDEERGAVFEFLSTGTEFMMSFNSEPGAFFGWSLASDGESLLIGERYANGGTGAVYLRSQLSFPVPVEAPFQGRGFGGHAVAISGTQFVASAPWAASGEVYTFDAAIVLSSEDEVPSETFTFDAYPNPTAGLLTLAFDGAPATRLRVEVIDLLGRTVKHVHDGLATGSIRTDVSSLPAGVYLLRAEADRQIEVRRIVRR